MGFVRGICAAIGGRHRSFRPSSIGPGHHGPSRTPWHVVAGPRIPVFVGHLQCGKRFLFFGSHGLRRVWRVGVLSIGQTRAHARGGRVGFVRNNRRPLFTQPLHHGRHHRRRHGLRRLDELKPLVARKLRGEGYKPCRGSLTGEPGSDRWAFPSF